VYTDVNHVVLDRFVLVKKRRIDARHNLHVDGCACMRTCVCTWAFFLAAFLATRGAHFRKFWHRTHGSKFGGTL
jgi:hypothetical protein